jgi:delta14-sterol reductase
MSLEAARGAIDSLLGFAAPWIVYAAVFLLHLALPARKVAGYALDPESGEPYRYRLNGILVLALALAAYAGLGAAGLMPWDWLYAVRWPSLAGACAAGLAFSLAVVLREPRADPESGSRTPFPLELYLGRRDNLRLAGGRADAKMYLYLAGVVMLALNLLSFAAHHVIAFGLESSALTILYSALFLWFAVDYLVFERVHLYTYDLVAEKVGFKLGWGCLTFYPYFYIVGLWPAATLPDPAYGAWRIAAYAAVFLCGWVLSRGANLQKYLFKRDRGRALLGILRPVAIADGERALLCSGFWKLSRHVNYLGEILMAIGLSLAVFRPGAWATWAAWLYPLYYVGLLFTRERADERRCAAKYGELWKEYERRVKYRIIPGIY